MNSIFIFSIAIAVILLIVFYVLYLEIIKRKNNAEEAWSGIDVQLKKRFDLVPNLVAVAKKYMEHEKEVFEQVTRLRAHIKPETDTRIKNELQLGTAINNLMVQVENYPELKADKQMLSLQKSLTEIEEHIVAARRFYNSAVADLNNVIKIFPGNLIAFILNIKEKEYFQAESIVYQNSKI